MMCTCHVERSEAKSKHLQKDTIPFRNDYLFRLVRLICVLGTQMVSWLRFLSLVGVCKGKILLKGCFPFGLNAYLCEVICKLYTNDTHRLAY